MKGSADPSATSDCAECGFRFSSVTVSNASAIVGHIATSYCQVLTASAENPRLRRRPAEGVWSPLEYAAHMRDVLLLFRRRVDAILEESEPALEVVSHDDEVARGNYNQLSLPLLNEQLSAATQRLATRLEGLSPEALARRGFRNAEARTVLEIAQRAVHESQHHLVDIDRGLGVFGFASTG
ncbi:MAG TPA: DinB family protein [Candidatus Dormibacteraeota bacterium]|nr:DinB family protein [Candidatus Dormibacteraeota bacterium]